MIYLKAEIADSLLLSALLQRKNCAARRALVRPLWQGVTAVSARDFPFRQTGLTIRFYIAICLAGLITLGCERIPERPGATISRERFVAVNVALRTADGVAAQRAQILKQHGVTEQQLRAFVRAYSRDTTLVGAWEEIAKRIEARDEKADGAAPAPTPREAPGRLRLPGAIKGDSTAPQPWGTRQ